MTMRATWLCTRAPMRNTRTLAALFVVFVVTLLLLRDSGRAVAPRWIRLDTYRRHELSDNGTRHTVYSHGHARGPGLVLVVATIANLRSFGFGRTFSDFVRVVELLEYDRGSIDLAFFAGTDEVFAEIGRHFDGAAPSFPRITVVAADFLASQFDALDHDRRIQRERRRLIARARNYVLFSSLRHEQYTLFLDADVVRLEHRQMLAEFVRSQRDIVVPRIARGDNADYDRNSWRGPRRTPSERQLALMDLNQWSKVSYEPRDARGMYHFSNHAEEIKNLTHDDERRRLDYAVELDSVGGAVLFAKSVVYKQGVVFPASYIVGTAWPRAEGYDGIETEGLCYLARPLGYKCWGMPNLVAHHTVIDG